MECLRSVSAFKQVRLADGHPSSLVRMSRSTGPNVSGLPHFKQLKRFKRKVAEPVVGVTVDGIGDADLPEARGNRVPGKIALGKSVPYSRSRFECESAAGGTRARTPQAKQRSAIGYRRRNFGPHISLGLLGLI